MKKLLIAGAFALALFVVSSENANAAKNADNNVTAVINDSGHAGANDEAKNANANQVAIGAAPDNAFNDTGNHAVTATTTTSANINDPGTVNTPVINDANATAANLAAHGAVTNKMFNLIV